MKADAGRRTTLRYKGFITDASKNLKLIKIIDVI